MTAKQFALILAASLIVCELAALVICAIWRENYFALLALAAVGITAAAWVQDDRADKKSDR